MKNKITIIIGILITSIIIYTERQFSPPENGIVTSSVDFHGWRYTLIKKDGQYYFDYPYQTRSGSNEVFGPEVHIAAPMEGGRLVVRRNNYKLHREFFIGKTIIEIESPK